MKKYFLIHDGTIIKEGDEFYYAGKWHGVPNSIGQPFNLKKYLYPVRRAKRLNNHPNTNIFK